MQKKLSIVLSVMLLTGLNNSVKADASAIKKAVIVAGLGTIVGAGQYAANMNEEYSRNKKDPDARMRATKALGAAVTLIGADLILNDSSTAENLVKIGAFSLALLATTEPVANVVREVPVIGGLLTDPIDENGNEKKDFGAIARFALVFIPVRDFLLSHVAIKKS
jgi:hypothetical protein